MKKMKKSLVYVLTAILVLTIASALVVTYLSNTITEEIAVESPITLQGNEGSEFSLDIDYAGEDAFTLIKLTNNADVEITGDLVIAVSPDIVGLHIAITEDINYCFTNQGNMTGVSDCETDYLVWLANNPDWMDWYADESYDVNVYTDSNVINDGGNSFFGLGYTGDSLVLPDLSVSPETTVYGLMYVASEPILAPDTYTFSITLLP